MSCSTRIVECSETIYVFKKNRWSRLSIVEFKMQSKYSFKHLFCEKNLWKIHILNSVVERDKSFAIWMTNVFLKTKFTMSLMTKIFNDFSSSFIVNWITCVRHETWFSSWFHSISFFNNIFRTNLRILSLFDALSFVKFNNRRSSS
jgi:hypothetical protein